MRQKIAILIGLIAFFAFIQIDYVRAANSIAPDFTLKDLSGKEVQLSDFKNKAIFLNFFATWCLPCREEMPSVQKLYDKKINNFIVLAAAIDKKGIGAVSRYIKENKYTFKVLLDPKNEAADKYEVKFVPTSFIINKKGEIVEKIIGARDWADADMIDRFKALAK